MEEKVFTFREFQKITYSKNKKLFSKLKKYIFDNNLEDDYEFFKISKDAIIVQNFVGTISSTSSIKNCINISKIDVSFIAIFELLKSFSLK